MKDWARRIVAWETAVLESPGDDHDSYGPDSGCRCEPASRVSTRKRLVEQIVRHAGSGDGKLVEMFSAGGVAKFCDALLLSGTESVDAFLEHRSDYLGVGKAAIAWALIPYERLRYLFESWTRPSRDQADWYQYLFSRMSSDTPFEKFGENKLSIVTFNYDRSLEMYLVTALENSYDKRRDEAVNVLAQIPVIHVHGQLGALPWQDRLARQYEGSLDEATIKYTVAVSRSFMSPTR